MRLPTNCEILEHILQLATNIRYKVEVSEEEAERRVKAVMNYLNTLNLFKSVLLEEGNGGDH